jgi:hypothetical protein
MLKGKQVKQKELFICGTGMEKKAEENVAINMVSHTSFTLS